MLINQCSTIPTPYRLLTQSNTASDSETSFSKPFQKMYSNRLIDRSNTHLIEDFNDSLVDILGPATSIYFFVGNVIFSFSLS
jgi:hypothetical protein